MSAAYAAGDRAEGWLHTSHHLEDTIDTSANMEGQFGSSELRATLDRVQQVAEETGAWLSQHQKFNINLNYIGSLVLETKDRLTFLKDIPEIKDLDLLIQHRTPIGFAEEEELKERCLLETKDVYNRTLESLVHFLMRAESVKVAYDKYLSSASTLDNALRETSETLSDISLDEKTDLKDIGSRLESVKSSRSLLTRMRTCLRAMKDAMSSIESLTLSVCDLGLEDYIKEYKKRRNDLAKALRRLETIQARMEKFTEMHKLCTDDIDQISVALEESEIHGAKMDIVRLAQIKGKTAGLNDMITEMQAIVNYLEAEGTAGSRVHDLRVISTNYNLLMESIKMAVGSLHHADCISPYDFTKDDMQAALPSKFSAITGSNGHSLDVPDLPADAIWLSNKQAEIASITSQTFPLQSSKQQLLLQQLQQLLRPDLESVESKTRSSGLGPSLHDLIQTANQWKERFNEHISLTSQLETEQAGLTAELSLLRDSILSLMQSDAPNKEQLDTCQHLLDRSSKCKASLQACVTELLPRVVAGLSEEDTNAVHNSTRELEKLADEIATELERTSESLQRAQVAQDKLLEDLGQAERSISDIIRQCSEATRFSEPIAEEFVKTRIRLMQRYKSVVHSCDQLIDSVVRKTALQPLPPADMTSLLSRASAAHTGCRNALTAIDHSLSSLQLILHLIESITSNVAEVERHLFPIAKSLKHADFSPLGVTSVLDCMKEVQTHEDGLSQVVDFLGNMEKSLTDLVELCGSGACPKIREKVKELEARASDILTQLGNRKQRLAMSAQHQEIYETLCVWITDWLRSVHVTLMEEITLKNGLLEMRNHIVKLNEIESSEELTVNWFDRTKQVVELLGAELSPDDQKKLLSMYETHLKEFTALKISLAEKVTRLSGEIEAVVQWIQRSAQLVRDVEKLQHDAIDHLRVSPAPADIQHQSVTLKAHKSQLESLSSTCSQLLNSSPIAAPDSQIKALKQAQSLCESVARELTNQQQTVDDIIKKQEELEYTLAECYSFIKTCQGQLEAVELAGVSLDARQSRYAEICEVLHENAKSFPTARIQELQGICSSMSGSSSSADSVIFHQKKLLERAVEGQRHYTELLDQRRHLEKDLVDSIRNMLSRKAAFAENPLIDDWSSQSCDVRLESFRQQRRALEERNIELQSAIKFQQKVYDDLEESLTLDYKESLEAYDSCLAELLQIVDLEISKMCSARNVSELLEETFRDAESWLTMYTVQGTETHFDILQNGLRTVAEVKVTLTNVPDHATKLSPFLTQKSNDSLQSYHTRLVEQVTAREQILQDCQAYRSELMAAISLFESRHSTVTCMLEHQCAERNRLLQRSIASTDECKEVLDGIRRCRQETEHMSCDLERLQEACTSVLDLLTQARPEGVEGVQDRTQERECYQSAVRDLINNKWTTLISSLDDAMTNMSERLTTWNQMSAVITQIEDNLGCVARAVCSLSSKQDITADIVSLQVDLKAAQENMLLVNQTWELYIKAEEMALNMAEPKPTFTSLAEYGNRLTSFADQCQGQIASVNAAIQTHEILRSQFSRFHKSLKDVNTEMVSLQGQGVSGLQIMIIELGKLETLVDKIYADVNDVVCSRTAIPKDIQAQLDQITELKTELQAASAAKIKSIKELMTQYSEVAIIEKGLNAWMLSTDSAVNGDIFDLVAGVRQQARLESELSVQQAKMALLISLSTDLERNIKEDVQLVTDRDSLQERFSGIKRAIEQRRKQLDSLQEQRVTIEQNMLVVEEYIHAAVEVQSQTLPRITAPQCERLLSQYTDLLGKCPAMEKIISDLLTSCNASSGSISRVLDLKDKLVSIKREISAELSIVKEVIACLHSDESDLPHTDWIHTFKEMKGKVSESFVNFGSDSCKITKVKDCEVLEQELDLLIVKSEKCANDMLEWNDQSAVASDLSEWLAQRSRLLNHMKKLQSSLSESLSRLEHEVKAAEQAVLAWKKEVADGQSNTQSSGVGMQRALSYDELLNGFNAFGSQMDQLLIEHDGGDALLRDVNCKLTGWQMALDGGDSVCRLQTIESIIQQASEAKSYLGSAIDKNLGAAFTMAYKSVETVELRAHAEKQTLSSASSLSNSQNEALRSIEAELMECKRTLEGLEWTPECLQVELPALEHRVSRLQRMFQTLESMNPSLCEDSAIPTNLTRLMNVLQRLQGRLDVIPEEDTDGDTHAEVWNPEYWQNELMRNHQSEPDETGLTSVETLSTALSASLRALLSIPRDTQRDSHEILTRYSEVLSAARSGTFGLTRRPILAAADKERQVKRNFIESVNQIRFHILPLCSVESESHESAIRLSVDMLSFQRACWTRICLLCRLSAEATRVMVWLERVLSQMRSITRRSLRGSSETEDLCTFRFCMEPEYGALKAIVRDLLQKVDYPELEAKAELCEELWDRLNIVTDPSKAVSQANAVKDLFAETLELQLRAGARLAENGTFEDFIKQAMSFAVDYESLLFIKDDIFCDDEPDGVMRAKLSSVEYKLDHSQSLMAARIEKTTPTLSDLRGLFSWLGCIPTTPAAPSSLTLINDYVEELLTRKSELRQRLFITDLLKCHVDANDGVLMAACHSTHQVLHKALLEIIEIAASAQLLRNKYFAYCADEASFAAGVNKSDSALKSCVIGDRKFVESLSKQFNAIAESARDSDSLKRRLSQQMVTICSHKCCTTEARNEISHRFQELCESHQGQIKVVTDRLADLQHCKKLWSEYDTASDNFSQKYDEFEFEMKTFVPSLADNDVVFERQMLVLQRLFSQIADSPLLKLVTSCADELRKRVTCPQTASLIDSQVTRMQSQRSSLCQELGGLIAAYSQASCHVTNCNRLISTVKESIRKGETLLCKILSSSEVSFQLVEEAKKCMSQLQETDWNKIRRYQTKIVEMTRLPIVQIDTMDHQIRHLISRLRQFIILADQCALPRTLPSTTVFSKAEPLFEVYSSLHHQLTISLNFLEVDLTYEPKSQAGHVGIDSTTELLKVALASHQRVDAMFRRVCQELIPRVALELRPQISDSVQAVDRQWQSIVSGLVSRSSRSRLIVTVANQIEADLQEMFHGFQSLRTELTAEVPNQHKALQEERSRCDTFQRLLSETAFKLDSKKTVMAETLADLDDTADLATQTSLMDDLMEDTLLMLHGRKSAIDCRLEGWGLFVSKVNKCMSRIDILEKYFMNHGHLTIEELLANIHNSYKPELADIIKQADHLLTEGQRLLPISDEIYASAIKHSSLSLRYAVTQLTNLAATRTAKLQETLTAIQELDSGLNCLTLWLENTEKFLNDRRILSWQAPIGTESLHHIEEDMRKRSPSVTAVINLCTALQHDQDALCSQAADGSVVGIKERLKERWHSLRDKVSDYAHWLSEVSVAWHQMRTLTDETLTRLKSYSKEYNSIQLSGISLLKAHTEIDRTGRLLENLTQDRDELKVINDRYRYLMREQMVDCAGQIKVGVDNCNALWDSLYKKLTADLRHLKALTESWKDFESQHVELITELGALSIALRTKPEMVERIQERLQLAADKINDAFEPQGVKLKQLSCPPDAVRVDTLLKEVQTSVDLLTAQILQGEEPLSPDPALDTVDRDSPPPSPKIPYNSQTESMVRQTANRVQAKIIDLDRRVSEAERRASLSRRLSTGSLGQLTTLPNKHSLSCLRVDTTPLNISPRSWSRSHSVESLSITSSDVGHISRLIAYSASSETSRASHWSDTSSVSSGQAPCSSPLSPVQSSTPRSLFDQRSVASRVKVPLPSCAPRRMRSSSLTRTPSSQSMFSRSPRSESCHRSGASHCDFSAEQLDGRSSKRSCDGSHDSSGYRSGSFAPLDAHSNADLTCPSSDISVARQLENPPVLSFDNKPSLQKHICKVLSWIEEVRATRDTWGALPKDLSSLEKDCSKYKELCVQRDFHNSYVISVNLICGMENSLAEEVGNLNTQWREMENLLSQRRSCLQTALLSCNTLCESTKRTLDTLTDIEFRLLNKEKRLCDFECDIVSIKARVSSLLCVLSPTIANNSAAAAQVMDCLQIMEKSCQQLLKTRSS